MNQIKGAVIVRNVNNLRKYWDKMYRNYRL